MKRVRPQLLAALAGVIAVCATLAITAGSGAAATVVQGEGLRAGPRTATTDRAGARHWLVLRGPGRASRALRVRRPSRLSLVARTLGCRLPSRIEVRSGSLRWRVTVRSKRFARVDLGRRSIPAGLRRISVALVTPPTSRRRSRCRDRVAIDAIELRAAAPTPAPNPGTPRWRPAADGSWQWQLSGPLDPTVDAATYDVDLFETSAAQVADLHRRGRKVVCYLSAGSMERGRPDEKAYPSSVLGKVLDGWPDEQWVDIRRLDVLGPILERRLDLCAKRGFDGVEPDNVEAYAQSTGFPLTGADQLRFNRWFAREAHRRGLAVALKNDLAQAAQLEPDFDWLLLEQCQQYDECASARPFLRAGKAVWDAEYTSRSCRDAIALGVLAVRKRLELDPSSQRCG